MSVRDLIDSTSAWFIDSDFAPTRAISYTRSSDDLVIPLNAFISGNEFNADIEDDKTVNKIICTVFLEQEPTRTDTFVYNSKTYTVRHWTPLGTPQKYSIIAENKKRNKTSSRSFR